MKTEDTKVVLGLIREEIKAFAKNADAVILEEMFQCKQALDGANKNIFKLQAQLTAVKTMLCQRGLLPREALYEEENKALEDLIKTTRKAETPVEATA